MKPRILIWIAAMTLLVVLAIPRRIAAQDNRDRRATIITFDAPGAVATFPFAINPAGAITGYYCDAITCHGFLRALDGAITPFDAPDDVNGTYAYSINPGGAITGYYCDAIACHGFLRARDGDITTFDVSGAQGTSATTSIRQARSPELTLTRAV